MLAAERHEILKKSKFEIIGGLSVRQLRNNVWSNYKTNNFTHLLELNQNFWLITKCDIPVLVCLLATCEMVIFTSIFSPVFGCYISRTSFNFSAVRCHPWQPADWRCSSSYFPLTPRITFQAETLFFTHCNIYRTQAKITSLLLFRHPQNSRFVFNCTIVIFLKQTFEKKNQPNIL